MNHDIPPTITVIVVAGAVAIAAVIWSILAWAVRRAGLPSDAARRVRVGSAVFLGLWLGTLLVFGPRAVPSPAPERFDPTSVITFTLAASIGLGMLAAARSAGFRTALEAIPLSAIHVVQTWRVMGVVFIVLMGRGLLPAHFALPAGWGDIFVGVTAPLVALGLARGGARLRALVIAWNVFGLVDLFVAVGMGSGILAGALLPGADHVPPAAAMGVLPMILVPAFAVPASLMVHMLALRRLARPIRLHPAAHAVRPAMRPVR